jgi:hypothetical protein
VITVFDDTQRSHAPREFIVSGKPKPIPERPERIDMLMEGVNRLGGPVVAPPEVFGDTIALVHDRRYIQFLGRDLAHRGQHALAEFDPAGQHGDAAIRRDANPAIEPRVAPQHDRADRRGLLRRGAIEPEADGEAGGTGGDRGHEAAAGKTFGAHSSGPLLAGSAHNRTHHARLRAAAA